MSQYPKDLIPPPCALGEIRCQNDPFACSAANLCTNCGCCPLTAIGFVGACPKGTFCGNPIADVPFCSGSGSTK